MPQTRGKASPIEPGISPTVRNLIVLYLGASIIAIALLLFGGDPLSGIFLVVFALPWSLGVSRLTGLLGLDSATLNLALLAIGVGINAAALYLLSRWMRHRQLHDRT